MCNTVICPLTLQCAHPLIIATMRHLCPRKPPRGLSTCDFLFLSHSCSLPPFRPCLHPSLRGTCPEGADVQGCVLLLCLGCGGPLGGDAGGARGPAGPEHICANTATRTHALLAPSSFTGDNQIQPNPWPHNSGPYIMLPECQAQVRALIYRAHVK